jgi:hypothetical protein
MKMRSSNSESGLVAGLKVVTLAVVLGFVAMASTPALVPATSQEAALAAPTATETADYFPSHYPAPTNVEEQAPTF